MRFPTLRGFYVPLLLAVGWTATTSAYPSNSVDLFARTSIPDVWAGFSRACTSVQLDNSTCILSASCTPRADTHPDGKPTQTHLNLNKCWRYYEKRKDEWMLEWNTNKQDQGE